MMGDLKESFKKIWEVKAARWSIIIGLLAMLLYAASSTMDKSTPEEKNRNIKKDIAHQAQGVVFDEEPIMEIDKQQNAETYEAMKKDFARREKEFAATMKARDKQLDAQSNAISKLQSDMTNLSRTMSLMAQNSAMSYQQNAGVNNRNVTRAGETGMVAPQDMQNGLANNSARSTYVNPQTQMITRSNHPEANGLIRTVSQGKVSQMKKSGEIEETPVQIVYVDSKTQKKDTKKAEDAKKAQQNKTQNPEITAKKRQMAKEKSKSYIPSGSIISGVMLNGVDAPTSLSKNATPLPVTVRVKLDVLMPNNYRADLQDCNITGSVTGDLASERAYIRAVSLSCINENGESIETGMAGYAVSDYDGRNGVRGRVVNRAGKALIATFGASFLSGIATATKPTAINAYDSTGSETTTFQTPNMGDVGASATMSGVAGGSDRLAKYFIAIADAQWPVIEVSPGTPITFMLEKGMTLPITE